MEAQLDLSLFKAVFSEAVEKLGKLALEHANNLAKTVGELDSKELERILLEALHQSREPVEELVKQRMHEAGVEVESVTVNPWYTATTGLYFPTKTVMGDICAKLKDGIEVCDKFALSYSQTADHRIVLQGVKYPVEEGECPSVEIEGKQLG